MWKDKGIERPKVIAIHGKKRHGKDSIGDVLADLGYVKLSFAEPLYVGLLAVDPFIPLTSHRVMRLSELVSKIGWEKAKDLYPEVRRLLQDYGTGGGRDIHGKDCWIKLLKEKVRNPKGKYYISDWRFPNEGEALESMDIELHKWKVFRPGFINHDEHSSEQGLPDSLFDTLISNDSSLENLRLAVLTLEKRTRGI